MNSISHLTAIEFEDLNCYQLLEVANFYMERNSFNPLKIREFEGIGKHLQDGILVTESYLKDRVVEVFRLEIGDLSILKTFFNSWTK